MKIGFIGPGGTGKTTTMDLLQDLLFLERIPSVVRPILLRHHLDEESMSRLSSEDRWKIQNEMFEARMELELSLGSRHTMTDRTLLDHAAYCFYYSANVIPDEIASRMLLDVRKVLETYDKLFYFPLGLFIPPNDGVRKQQYAYQMTIDFIMRGILRRVALGQYVVPAGSPEERASWVRKCVMNLDT